MTLAPSAGCFSLLGGVKLVQYGKVQVFMKTNARGKFYRDGSL